MILAAAAYADDASKKPPPELSLAFKAEQWGVLPELGGLRDQRIGELERMTAYLNVYRAMKGYKEARTQEERERWRKSNPQGWAIYLDILKLRKDGEE